MYNEDLKHINTQDQIVFDWNKFHNENGIVPKPGNGPNFQSAESIAAAERKAKAERERVAKRTAEETFDQVYSLKINKRT